MPPYSNVRRLATRVVNSHRFFDLHTHNFPPEWPELLLTGPDDLLTYHYVLREWYRHITAHPELGLTPVEFNKKPKNEQAELIWQWMFVEQRFGAPISEAGVSVIEIFATLGFSLDADGLNQARAFHREAMKNPQAHFDFILKKAGVSGYAMTCDPFVELERNRYLQHSVGDWDKRCVAGLRLDDLVLNWAKASAVLTDLGYLTAGMSSAHSYQAAIRFVVDFAKKLGAPYLMISLPPDFSFPEERAAIPDFSGEAMIRSVILPAAREAAENNNGKPLKVFVMPGVIRQMNPDALGAGDGCLPCNLTATRQMAKENPDLDFWVTPLSEADQFQLAVDAAVFPNIVPWGTWWYNLQPSLASSISLVRIEMLGTSVWPQHSDARHLWHLLSKWNHTRQMLIDVLTSRFEALEKAMLLTGKNGTEEMIQRTLSEMFNPAKVGIVL